jgi:peptidoglycan pentaglycine glycine transferase (the first glycine)
MRELFPCYSSEVDTVDEPGWYRLLETFDDANIYQTWSYDEVRCGRENISHLLLKKNGEIVAAAQSRIAKLPLVKAGVAYIRWGPLWHRQDHEWNLDTFRQAIRALRNEYACKRGLVLRLRPALFSDTSSCFASILAEEGFSSSKGRPERTLLLDVNQPLEGLRKGLRPHWHRYLKVAEKNGLEIVEGSDDNLFEAFVGIYREMVGRKRFIEPNDIREFRLIQNQLPDKFKMKILLCKAGDKLCAGLVCSTIGKTAVYLFGATSNVGLKSRGSYLLQWKLIEWLKQNEVTTYDLHGINPAGNPGTYKFKADLCGNNGKDVQFVGLFDSHTSALSYLCVVFGDRLRMFYRALKKLVDQTGRAPTNGPAYSGRLVARSD